MHFREPGLTHKGSMSTEAKSARAGGITTVCDMPNTIPATTSIDALLEKIHIAESILDCDIRFFFGLTEKTHIQAFREVWTGNSEASRKAKARCCGAKIFLDHSTGNQRVDEAILEEIFAFCGDFAAPLVAHCENAELNAMMAAQNTRINVAAHSIVRPAESEEQAIGTVLALAEEYGTAVHIAHLSTERGLDIIRRAKVEGHPVTCEVAPHHLFFTTDDYEQCGTKIKVNPPIRSMKHRNALWAGLSDGTIDCIASDHAPHTLAEKNVENPLLAPSGLPGVETTLPLLLTVAAGGWPHPNGDRPPYCTLHTEDIVRLCFTNPNRIFGLNKRDGRKDRTVDHIEVDLDEEWLISAEKLHAKCQWTPYEGWKVRGKVTKVHRATAP